MRALLLANATVATLTGRRANSPASQGSPAMGRRLRHPTTALAPWIISRRMYPSPRFEIRPRRSLPPLDRCCGTSPSHAANCRPDLNWVASPTVATIALAVIGPTPGIVASRRVTSFARCQAISSPSTTATRAATSDQKVAGSVEQENGLLVGALDRHEPHSRPLHRFADRFGIRRVVLLALDVGPHELRRHEPNLVTERSHAPNDAPCGKPRCQPTPAQDGRITAAPRPCTACA